MVTAEDCFTLLLVAFVYEANGVPCPVLLSLSLLASYGCFFGGFLPWVLCFCCTVVTAGGEEDEIARRCVQSKHQQHRHLGAIRTMSLIRQKVALGSIVSSSSRSCPCRQPTTRLHQQPRIHSRITICQTASSEASSNISSSEAATQTELVAAAGIESAAGADLHENGKHARSSSSSSPSMHKLKTQVDEIASKYVPL